MLKTLEKLYSHAKTYHSFNVLSEKVKTDLGLSSPEDYDKNKMELTITHEGNKGIKKFVYLSCRVCHKDKLPELLRKYKHKLPDQPKVSDLMENWDLLDISIDLIDIAGCLIPDEKHLHAAPNGRRFIIRPTEHAAFHVKPSSTKAPPSKSNVTVNKIVSDAGKMQTEAAITTKSRDNSVTVTMKHNKKMKLAHIGSLLEPKIALHEPCQDSLDTWSKTFCLKTVHTGVKKQVSNNASIDFYNSVIDGVKDYHNTVLSGVEVNNCKLAPPPKVQLNKNNIFKAQNAILDSYRHSKEEDNPYNQLNSHSGKYYSVSHDGIQKFSKELNGVFIRSLSTSSMPINVPWSLTEIEGGSLNAKKLIRHIIETIAEVKPIKNNAFVSIEDAMKKQRSILVPEYRPPQFFKMCSLLSVTETTIDLECKEWPVTIMADGCSVNVSAGNQLADCFGLVSPSLRCVVHAADGSLKRLANSKTMNVPEISEFLPPFRTILKHFQKSGKSTSLLNEALDQLDMKQLHLVSFCPTRMAYLLSACIQVVNMIVPFSDVLTTADIRVEERDTFLSPKSLCILHLLADLEPIFQKDYLKILDLDDSTIITAYETSMKFADKIKNKFESKRFNTFLDGLYEDENGNIIAKCEVNGQTCELTLNYNHRPSRNPKSKIDSIKEQAKDIKEKLITNIVSNVIEQSQADTLVELSSMFDMARTIDLQERITYLKKLHTIFGTNYQHVIDPEKYNKEIANLNDWSNFIITIKYPKKLTASEEEMVKQFRNIWPIFNRLWPKYREDKKFGSNKFFQHIIENHTITHPDVMELLKILLAVAPSTGPLERSYSKLAKICYKDRNQIAAKNLETLYLLSSLKDPNIDYSKAITILENETN